MGFSRQEYQSGLPFPYPGDLPDPGIEPVSFISPALAGGTVDEMQEMPKQGMQETRVQSLGQEDPLEEGMTTTQVFLLGESHGQRSLADYSPWGCKEMDTTEAT